MFSFSTTRLPLLLASLLLLCTTVVQGQSDSDGLWASMRQIVPKGYVCYQATSGIRVDGRLDDDAWRAAPWTDPFVDIEGDVKPRPRFQTRAMMLWDSDYFYFAAKLEEPHVWATLKQHDSVIFHDNDFEVFIDPNGDNHEYYEFEINALNTGWDLFLPKPYTDSGRADNSWEIPGLKTAVHVAGTLNDPNDTDDFWSVEIGIPWRALAEFAHRPTPPADGDQWRVGFSRVQWQVEVKDGVYQKVAGLREDNWVWSPQGIINMHRPERWGFVQFSTATPGDARFEPDPHLAVRDALMAVYHRQRAFRKQHGRWASSNRELGTEQLAATFPSLEIETTSGGFRASIDLPDQPVGTRHWHVREDSKLWSE